MRRKLYPISALFSIFIIGLGQIIKGHSKKGLKWILFFYLFFPALTYVSFLINAYIFIVFLGIAVVVYPIFWLYNVADALFTQV